MDWKKEAAGKLKDYSARRRALEALPRQIEEVRLRRQGIHAARTDGMAVGGGGCGREDRMIDSMLYEEELERRLEVTRAWVAGVEAGLEALGQEERLILERFYINPTADSVDRLCGELGLERAAVYRRKDLALRRFTMALYGWEEV